MQARKYPLFGFLLAVLALALGPLLFPRVPAPVLTGEPILEVNDHSLTTYRRASATNVQDIQPRVEMRGTNLDGSLRSRPSFSWAVAGNPFGAVWSVGPQNGVKLETGTAAIQDVDIRLPAPGFSWVVARTYNARQDTGSSHRNSNGYQGRNWFQDSQPEIALYEHASDDAEDIVYLIYGADRYLEFKRYDATSVYFKAKNGAAGTIEFVEDGGGADTYVYTDQVGNEITFFGFDTPSNDTDGQLWKIEDPATNVAYVGDSTNKSTALSSGYAEGRIVKAYDTADRRYAYTYTELDSVDRLTQVEVETKTGGTWAGTPTGLETVAQVDYEYYTNETYGDVGDLKLVTITEPLSDSGVDVERKKYYRYWEGTYNASTNPGYPHALKLILDYEGARRFDWEGDSTFDEDFLTASHASLESYAAAYFEYDTSHRIDEAYFNGECGCGGGANGSHEYTYGANGSYTDGTGYDTTWFGRTIVKKPDGSYETFYFDEARQALSRVLTDDDPSNTSPAPETWATYVIRDSTSVVTDIRTPANTTGYTHSTGAFTSSTSAGLINTFEYWSASDERRGYLKFRKWQEGTSGTAYYDLARDYDSSAVDITTGVSLDVYRLYVDMERVYSVAGTDVDPTSARERGRGSDFHSGVTRSEVTDTLEAVTTANNGSDSANTRMSYFETDGRLSWSEDEGGVLTYRGYTNGQLTTLIEDADTSQTSNEPSGWAASGIHRETTHTYDAQGRPETTTLPDGRVLKQYTSKLADGRVVRLSYPKYDSVSGKYYGPVNYTVVNHAGQVEVSARIALTNNETTSAITAHIDETDSDPILAADLGTLVRMSTSHYSDSGEKLTETRLYFDIPASGAGTDGTNYDPTLYGYDDKGRRTRVKEPTGTIRRSVYDVRDQMTQSWIGTNDSSFAGGESSGTDNMVKTQESEFDSGNDGGNGFRTKSTAFVEDGTTDKRETTFEHDARGNLLLQTNPEPPHAFHAYDNLRRRTATGLFSSTGSITVSSDDPTTETANRLALSETYYDEQGRIWKTILHEIDASDGSSDDTLESLSWYSAEGELLKVDGKQLVKYSYDSLGRRTHTFILANDNDSGYGAVSDVEDDVVLEESQSVYDEDTDLVLMRATISRHPDDYGGMETVDELDTNADADNLKYTATNIEGRIQITANWYDNFNRLETVGFYGTNGGSDFDRDGLSAPTSSSSSVLVTTYSYGTDGEIDIVTDPKGIDAKSEHDDAGRLTKTIRNYDSGVNSGNPSGTDDNQTVRYEYTDGLRTKLIADMPAGTNDQETVYTYGTAKGASAGDSEIATGHLLQEVEYPDSVSATDVGSYAYNAQGELIWQKDQAGNVIEIDLDDAGREEHRRVTTLDSDFDGAVRRISTTYTDLGQRELVTQYDNATVGSGSVVDEVKFTWAGWGLLTKFEQDRNSAVGAGGSVDDYEVSYTYEKATTGRNTIRKTQMVLPSGAALNYGYTSTDLHDDDVSRVSFVKHGTVRICTYDYLGVAQVVGTLYNEPDVMWMLYDTSSGTTYPDLDAFNRVTSSRWTKDLGADIDFYNVDITYDYKSNITLVEDNVHTGFDVEYTMDDLDRLVQAEEGSWNGSSIINKTRDQFWTLSHTGNWAAAQLDLDGDGNYSDPDEYDDDRTHNDVNELTARDTDDDGSVDFTLTYDEVGNLTDAGDEHKYVYDPFGRLRKVLDRSDESVLAEYKYNGLGFMLSEHVDTDDDGDVDSNDKWFHTAYDERWRRLAVFREGDSNPKKEFSAHQAGLSGWGTSSYVDGIICRDRDANTDWDAATDGTMEERLNYCHNWRRDVVALVKSNGFQVESARYLGYGIPFGLAGADTDSDGYCEQADIDQIQTWIDASSYDVRGDLNLDGALDSLDKTSAQNFYLGFSLGWSALSDAAASSVGYASYIEKQEGLWLARKRVANTTIGRWMRRDPLGYVDSANMYEYAVGNPVLHVDPTGGTVGDLLCKHLGGHFCVEVVAGGGTIGIVIGDEKQGCIFGATPGHDRSSGLGIKDADLVTVCCNKKCCTYNLELKELGWTADDFVTACKDGEPSVCYTVLETYIDPECVAELMEAPLGASPPGSGDVFASCLKTWRRWKCIEPDDIPSNECYEGEEAQAIIDDLANLCKGKRGK